MAKEKIADEALAELHDLQRELDALCDGVSNLFQCLRGMEEKGLALKTKLEILARRLSPNGFLFAARDSVSGAMKAASSTRIYLDLAKGLLREAGRNIRSE